MKTVLIIDDDSDFRSLTGGILKQEGWKIWEAGDGKEGITLARLHRPKVVLCDLLMPGGNGFRVCRTITRDPALQQTKIIVTSGRDFSTDRGAAKDAGAHEYLTKPINPAQLVQLMSRITGASESKKKGRTTARPKASSPMRLKFWGVRGSIPTPGPTTLRYGGNTTCIEVRAEGEIIILDAGTGLRPLGRELLSEFDNRPLNLTLLLTHTHWDHIQGLPFFLPIYKPHNRLRILGYEGAREGLAAILSGQMENPYFPIGLGELPGNISIEELKDLHFNIGQVRVEAWFANHPGICVGYRLFTADGSIAFFPDNEMHYRHRPAPEGANAKALRDFVKNQEQKMIDFLHGVDVLIIDAQYSREEYKDHLGWGHGCVDDVVALALKAEAKQLFLFHHDPEHDDDTISRMVEHAREIVASQKSSLRVDAAREGLAVELAAGRKVGE